VRARGPSVEQNSVQQIVAAAASVVAAAASVVAAAASVVAAADPAIRVASISTSGARSSGLRVRSSDRRSRSRAMCGHPGGPGVAARAASGERRWSSFERGGFEM